VPFYYRADISADGRYVAFEFRSTDILPGTPWNALFVYRLDRATGVVERVGGLGADQAGDPSIDDSGRYVLADVVGTRRRLVRYDLVTGEQREIATSTQWVTWTTALSGDGNRVAYVGSEPPIATLQLWVADLTTGERLLASSTQDGTVADVPVRAPSLDQDGGTVAFETSAPSLTGLPFEQIAVKDLETGELRVASRGVDGLPAYGFPTVVDSPSLSDDGTRVAYRAYAANFPGMDWPFLPQAFVSSTRGGRPVLVSLNAAGEAADLGATSDPCEWLLVGPPCSPERKLSPAISGDGRVVAFHSFSTNLAPDAPTTLVPQVYLGAVPIAAEPVPVPAPRAWMLALALAVLVQGMRSVHTIVVLRALRTSPLSAERR
jgi:hypothetical protein